MTDLAAVVCDVEDPELPHVTIGDLGIVRAVRVDGRTATVVLTPTYTGCPATLAIRMDVVAALAAAGIDARLETTLTPPWTTDDITEEGRRKLRAYGIATPLRQHAPSLFTIASVACPRCGSRETERISEFGSTPCKALWRCKACSEPFDVFKCI
ncbi:MAG TPA: 1,2-phenylacetyl-CoA epoxidase subunit PaaD [Gemmatimonadaceae bacterium]|nr:1,2-phenylacetyl-CoA epoxidase subunit PaaD [Gemmatimonadaceae bacterium]